MYVAMNWCHYHLDEGDLWKEVVQNNTQTKNRYGILKIVVGGWNMQYPFAKYLKPL